jgi:hypothetical protein
MFVPVDSRPENNVKQVGVTITLLKKKVNIRVNMEGRGGGFNLLNA